jgi:hypothetical protein
VELKRPVVKVGGLVFVVRGGVAENVGGTREDVLDEAFFVRGG